MEPNGGCQASQRRKFAWSTTALITVLTQRENLARYSCYIPIRPRQRWGGMRLFWRRRRLDDNQASITLMLCGPYGLPDGDRKSFAANLAAISRRLRPLRRSRRASFRAASGAGLRPSQRPSRARLRARAPANLATSSAFWRLLTKNRRHIHLYQSVICCFVAENGCSRWCRSDGELRVRER